ncbi:MAG TPA: hypothetical protein VN414_09185 [Methanosarcina sp.]|nr:hypothetical protein [Methanosarcina sp.]
MRKIKQKVKVADKLSREESKQEVISKSEINPDVKLKVVEESADIVHLVLPQKLNAASGGCMGCDGVGGCGFCECKSNISDRVQIRDQVQIKNQKQIKNQLQR